MSQISPASQPLYGGNMPSGTASYASPTVSSHSIPPHKGMNTDEIVLTVVVSSVAAVAIGTGIYYLAKKDKPSGKTNSATSSGTQRRDGNNHADATSSHGTRSESASRNREQVQHGNNHAEPESSHVTRSAVHETEKKSDNQTISSNVIAFFHAMESKPIRDVDRLFKLLNSEEKNKVMTSTMESVRGIDDRDELESIKRKFFICENGHLSSELNQAFNRRAKDLGVDDIDFNKEIEMFESFSEAEQAKHVSNDIKIYLLDSHDRDMIKFYYSRFMGPKTTPRVREIIDRW